MLCVTYKQRVGAEGFEKVKTNEWHVGEQLPDVSALAITAMEADGEEMGYIAKMFPAFTPHNKRTAKWVGVIAQNIFANLGGTLT